MMRLIHIYDACMCVFLHQGSIGYHRLRPQSYQTASHSTPFQCQSKLQVLTCVSDCGYKLEVPMMPFSGLIKLVEWLIELRETFY